MAYFWINERLCSCYSNSLCSVFHINSSLNTRAISVGCDQSIILTKAFSVVLTANFSRWQQHLGRYSWEHVRMELLGTILKFQQLYLFFTGFDVALTQPCLNLVWCLPLPLGKCDLVWGKRALGARPLPSKVWNFPPPCSCPETAQSEPHIREQQGGCTPRAKD